MNRKRSRPVALIKEDELTGISGLQNEIKFPGSAASAGVFPRSNMCSRGCRRSKTLSKNCPKSDIFKLCRTLSATFVEMRLGPFCPHLRAVRDEDEILAQAIGRRILAGTPNCRSCPLTGTLRLRGSMGAKGLKHATFSYSRFRRVTQRPVVVVPSKCAPRLAK